MTNIEILKRLYKDYTKKYLHKIFLAVFFSILVAGSTSATAWLLDPAIEKIFINKDQTLIFIIPILIIAAFSTKGISLYMAKVLMIKVAEEVKKKIQIDMLSSFIKADTEVIDSKHSGKYISNLNFDVGQITGMLSNSFLNFFKDGLTLIGLLTVMFVQNWRLSLIAIIMIPLASFTAKKLGKRMGKVTTEAQEKSGDLNKYLIDLFKNHKIIKIFQRENYENKRITHCEIHPSLILGLMANQIIFPENNPYPRDAFSCGQAKQSVSLYHSNYQNRLDKSAFVLNYGQIPLTKSRYLNFTTQEEHPYGENAIVAIMCYSGYNVEDAIIVNEGSLKRGLFSTTYYNTYEAHEEHEKVGNLSISSKFMNVNDVNITGLKPGYDYSNLDVKTGIIKENTIVTDKSVIIGKATNSITALDTYIDNSIVAKKGQVGIVDKAFITKGEEGTRISKVRIRAERIPHIGDKFCSRAGQKGTIGIVLREQDMPCTKDGIRPDIIVNPHAMPSRMTIGHLVETIISKVGSVYGAFGDCTAFQNKGSKHKEFGELLTRSGYHSSGCQILYNGMTGEQLETEIYFGPTYYLRLKHQVKDKVQSRARGRVALLTRQPTAGKAMEGGLRFGDMEKDTLIAHGASLLLKERFDSDIDTVYVGDRTGDIAEYNPVSDKFESVLEPQENVSKIRIAYGFKLLLEQLKSMGIRPYVTLKSKFREVQ